MKKFLSYFIAFLAITNHTQAQTCELRLSGQVFDKGTDIPLVAASLFLEDQQAGVYTDDNGSFTFDNLCPGDYHLRVNHVGCEEESFFIKLQSDTSISITMHHHAELLDKVVVHGDRADNSAQNSSTIGRKIIENNSSKNLSDILETITGVSTIRSGSGISKPVIHGLSGNRVAILNNGIEQSGQQWGNDHAPEIDPFVADHLSVVKGASALAYGANALGSVVLVEGDAINQDPHLHGRVNYTFSSNGLGHTLNTRIEKNSPWAAWRLSGSLKFTGDRHTPDYFLTNSGNRESNLALKIEKPFSDHWQNDFYISTFNTEIGILRGSHIGNLTDLENAFERDIPFFTADTFSYTINPPRQEVGHHLFKVESRYFIDDFRLLKFKYGGQINNRKEFDVRRGDRSHIPTLSLLQFSNDAELMYQQNFEEDQFLKVGLQYRFVDNVNDPDAGVAPLIPNYDAHRISAFAIFQNQYNKLFYEVGSRYDYKHYSIVAFSTEVNNLIIRPKHQFHNYTFSGGFKYNFSKQFKANFNIGYMLRAPEVNELYSFGLHQGVSGIEEGDPNLDSEKSLKGVLSLDWYFKKKVFLQALGYYHQINDFIYLQPQDEFRLTISVLSRYLFISKRMQEYKVWIYYSQ